MDNERKTIAVEPRKPAAYRYDEQLPAESTLLEELLKTADLQQLFESFYQLVNIPVAVIDLHANVLVSSRWQRICMLFHRVHPLACSRCIESDTYLATQLQEGKEYAIYECRNGLTDCASPIFIEGKHVANLFIGQFLTKAPDEEWFRRQGRGFGFDEKDYLAALREVPVVEPEKIQVVLNLLVRMTRLITTLAISRKNAVEAQARQSLILNTIPQSVFWKDINGRYLGCNVAFAKTIGVASPEDIIGKTDFDLPWPHEEAEAYRADDQAVISANQPRLHIIEPVQRADGKRIVVDTSKVPLIDATGNAPAGVVGIYEDITEQTQAEEALRESEARFHALSESSLAGIYIVQEGRLTYVNPALARIFGYQVGELVGTDPLLVIHPDDRALVAENMQRRLSGEQVTMHYEFRGLRKDGSINNVDVLGARMEVKGHPAIVGNIIDITERKHAEEELRNSEAYRRAIFDSARDAIIVMRNEIFIDCNAVTLALYGTDMESFIGHTPYEFSPPTQPDGRPSKNSALEKIGSALNGVPQFFEWKHHQLNGTPFDAEVSLGRVEVGNEVFIQAIVRDITARKAAEIALHQLNRQLRAISACNEFLVRAEKEEALLDGICTIVCAQGGYRMAWVGYAEQDEGKTVRPVAWAGAEDGYLSSANISWADTERGRGPTGVCIRNAEAVYIQDFATDPRVVPWRDNALLHGFRSSIALPLKGGVGAPFGALMVYSADANAFTPGEIQLLGQLANDLAFGIAALQTRAERVMAEESLRISEERFELSMEATSDGLWDWNSVTNEVYYSPACYHMLGYEVGDFPGTLKGWQDLLHPDDVEHTVRVNMDCVEGRSETFSVEYRLRAKNGEWRWILGRGKSIVRDAQGRALRLVGTNTDITEHRRAEERLHESETRFRSAFMTGAVAFVIVEEATGKIFEVNDQFLKLYGYDKAEVIGHTSLELGMWATPEARTELLAQLQACDRVENFEVLASRKGGEKFWVLYSVTRLTLQGSHLLLGAINDITARKEAEKRIEDYVKQLEGTLESTLQAVSSMVEMRDPYTAGHELRVGLIAADIAREMGWPEEKQRRLQLIGLVHDIGKIAVPAEILTKPTRLSDLEFPLVKTHAEKGYEILKDVRSEMPVAEIIRQHHERMDGSGYPQGLKGDQILMEARILAVADVLESMASHRPYRPALGIDAAIKEINGGRGAKFDETVVDTLLRMIREKGYKLPE